MEEFDEYEKKQHISFKPWKMLGPFARPYRKIFALVLSMILFISVIDVLLPLFQRYAIDNYIQTSSTDGLWKFALLYFSVIFVQCFTVVIFTRNGIKLEMCVGRDLKKACFYKLQLLSFSYYSNTPVGYMVARVMSDTSRISGMLAWGLIDALWAFVYVVGVFCAMMMLNIRLALLVLAVVPAIALLTVIFQGRLLRANRKIRQINSQITTAYNEGITGAKTSKTLGIEEDNFKGFSKITYKMKAQSVLAARMSGIYIPAVVFCSFTATAIVLARGGMMVSQDLMQIGTLSAMTTYAISIFEPIQQLARVFADMLSLQVNLERVDSLLKTMPDITDPPEIEAKYGTALEPKTENYEKIKGDIEFRNVSFKYPDGGDYVLKDFSLKISAGTTVAIVGETGVGKSTLVNLACRFYEPTEGQVLIDGMDYKQRSQHWLHSSIGYVLQTPHLFSGTLKDNIRYGKLDATDEQIEAAAAAVSVDTVVSRLEKGYDTDVGEGGDNLSVGEKQLVSFARAIIADPRFFVLDEATSSVDTHTEELIGEAIDKLLEGRTSFLIAHRLSTIRKAQLILVVAAGNIVEQGTHEQLLKKGGSYAALYKRQFDEEAALESRREIRNRQ